MEKKPRYHTNFSIEFGKSSLYVQRDMKYHHVEAGSVN